MPKKTREQKLHADQHRHAHATSFTFQASNETKASTDAPLFANIRSDIRKTVILGALFLTAEVMMYFLFR